MIISALFVVTYAIILTIAPAVRYHAGGERYQFNHWLGVVVWMIAFSILHQQSSTKMKNRDPFILPVVALLSGIGLMTIWRLSPNLGLRQTIWVAISSLIVVAGLRFPVFLDYLRRYKYIWLSLGLALTLFTLFFGSNPNGSGVNLWLNIFGVYLQPSEPLKLLLIIYLAAFFTDRMAAIQKTFETILPTIVVIAIAVALMVVQRDLGTASIFVFIYLTLLFSASGNKQLLWMAPVAIGLTGLLGYFFVDIVRLRVDTWLNPFNDPTGASYQIIQSMTAIAEGGLLGTGAGLGSPGFIPVSVSDFIFSAITEELGYLGAMIIILLFMVLIYRGVKIALSAQNSFHRYMALGLVHYFGIQSILIIGGNIGLLPLTGVTLPFVSYGGSSLVISFIAALFLLCISQQTPEVEEAGLPAKARITLPSTFLLIILIIEIISISLISFWFASAITSRNDNPRWIVDDRFSERGDIIDRDNQIIITNNGSIGTYQRISNYMSLFPVVGYTNAVYGKTGIEASMYGYLRGNEGYPYLTFFWQDLLYNQPPEGLDIRLTIDLQLQQTADQLLGDDAGALILMNAKSGEILAMASHPYFDAADPEADWEALIHSDDAPLINRATQGVFPPGASLLPFILTTQIDLVQNNPDPDAIFNNNYNRQTCALPPGKEVTWQVLTSSGCEKVQVELAKLTGEAALVDLFQRLGFFTEPDLYLNVAEATSPEVDEINALYKGIGSIYITPLQMALAGSALTNEGVLPGPRIINAYHDPDGNWITLPKQTANSQVLSPEDTRLITDLLQEPDSPRWQVTATALSENDEVVSWYLAGTTAGWQGQPIVAVVVLEGDSPEVVAAIGRSLMDQAIRNANE